MLISQFTSQMKIILIIINCGICFLLGQSCWFKMRLYAKEKVRDFNCFKRYWVNLINRRSETIT